MKQISLLMASLFLVVGVPFVVMAADVNVNINVSPPPPPAQEESPPAESAPEAPPPLEFAAPPDMVVVPSGRADVYLVPNMAGLYFYGGNWYRFHRGYWFRASIYNGPWVTILDTLVPPPIVVIPPDYVLGMPPGYHRIHYDEFHSHWRDWGRNRYWHNHPWYREHAAHHWGGREFVRPAHLRDRGPGDKGFRDRKYDDKRGKVGGDRKVGRDRGPHDKDGKVGGDRKTIGTDRKHEDKGGKVGGDRKTIGTDRGPRDKGGKIGGDRKVGTDRGHGGGSPGGAGPGAGGHGGGKPGGAGPKAGHPGKTE